MFKLFEMFSIGKKKSDSTEEVQITQEPHTFFKDLKAISKEDREKLEDIYDKLIENKCDIKKCNFNAEDIQKAVIMDQYLSKESQFSYLSDNQRRLAAILDAARGEGKHFRDLYEVNEAVSYKDTSKKTHP